MQKTEPVTSSFDDIDLKTFKHYLPVFEIVMLVLIVLAIILAIIFANRRSANYEPPVTPPKGITSSQKAIFEENHGQYANAEQAWQSQLSSTSTTEDKLNIYFEQSSTALQFKKYQDATNYANQAMSLNPNSSIPYVALANISMEEGNNAQAKQYWQQAINKLNPNDPGYNIMLEEYTQSLESIK